MEYLISAVWIGIELLCNVFFCGAFLERKERSKARIITVIIVWIIIEVYSNSGVNPLVKQAATLLLFTFISFLLYNGNWISHILLTLICYIFLAAIDIISMNGICALLGISYYELIWRRAIYTAATTMEKLLVCYAIWLLYQFREKKSLTGIHNKWLLLSCLFPAVSVVMLIVYFYNFSESEETSTGIVVFGGILMIANIAMLYVISAIEKATMQEQETRLLKQQISLQAENYSALKENYSVQRKSTHEFERHIQVMRNLLDRGEFDLARNYVCQLQSSRALKIFSIHSNNPVIDVVLNQKHQFAQENEITMRVQVNDLSSFTYPTDKLVVLISNLLDNAIEACLRTEGRREILCSILREDGIYISIRNTSKPVAIMNGEIATSKPNAAEHGFGLPAVKYILGQMNAEYTFVYKDGWFQFVAEIP